MIYGILDPGHYGKYNQGVNYNYWESESNLSFCKELKTVLEATGQFKIQLTRSNELDISLTSRGIMAKDKDFFLSAHSDSAGQSTGALVIDSVDLDTEAFALELTKACAEGYNIPVKPVREREYKNSGEDYYTVIDKAQDIGCPLVHLLERGNHSNIVDCNKLLDRTLQTKAVNLVASVYMKYFNVVVSEFPQWQEDLITYGMNKGYIKDYHKPNEVVEMWTLMAILKNRDERKA